MNASSATTSIPVSTIACMILRPKKDEQSIAFILTDGKSIVNTFADDKKCNKAWANLEAQVKNQDFVHFHDLFFRAEMLASLACSHTEETGYCLHLNFRKGLKYKQQYADEKNLKTDHAVLAEILAILQDVRAGRRTSPTKH